MTVQPDPQSFTSPIRRDGWSPERKVIFLDALSRHGNVREAARLARISAQAAYIERRRDARFNAAWAAAMLLARDHAEQVLASCATEGFVEEVWYRGEQVGTRRRFDSRLLLAHLARLDRGIPSETAQRHAGRFDELLAIIAGESFPAEMEDRGEGFRPADPVLPAARDDYARQQAGEALIDQVAYFEEHQDDTSYLPGDVDGDELEYEEREDLRNQWIDSQNAQVCEEARAEWDCWQQRAFVCIDAALAGADDEASASARRTVSTVSTSAELCGPEQAPDFIPTLLSSDSSPRA